MASERESQRLFVEIEIRTSQSLSVPRSTFRPDKDLTKGCTPKCLAPSRQPQRENTCEPLVGLLPDRDSIDKKTTARGSVCGLLAIGVSRIAAWQGTLWPPLRVCQAVIVGF
jgi:hypothetical protein